jgi:predicted nucleic acid-binding protein
MVSKQPPGTIRVFLDSTVLMAACISATGAGRELVLCGLRGEIELFISPLVVIESERNLRKKAPQALPFFDAFMEALSATVVAPSSDVVLEVAKLVALKDAPIVAAAMAAEAHFLASYDRKHLIGLRDLIQSNFGVQVVLPDEILKSLRGEA